METVQNHITAELLNINEIVALISDDAKTTGNLAETARRMDMSPSALSNAVSRGSIPFRGVYNFCKYEKKPMEYYLTGFDPFDQDEFHIRISEMTLEQDRLKRELDFVKEERDRLLLAISGQLNKSD